jgi:DNA-binding GntR family transcriptional regulator
VLKKKTKRTNFQVEVDRVIKLIQNEIYSGHRLPHEHLIEKNLSETYNVSRVIIRQVLSVLASDGLVEIEPYKGATVAALTIDRIVDEYQALSMLEGFAAKLAAQHINGKDIKKLNEILSKQKKVKDGDAKTWRTLNRQFHKTINQKCGNEKIIQMIRQHAQFVSYWFLIYINPGFEKDILAHEKILQALIERDGDMARISMEEHITVVIKRTVEHIQKNVPIGMFRSV